MKVVAAFRAVLIRGHDPEATTKKVLDIVEGRAGLKRFQHAHSKTPRGRATKKAPLPRAAIVASAGLR
jgi:hypothetical protein